MVTNCSAADLLPAESTQSFTHSCTTYSLIPSDPNTPQSPAATAPLLKRGQPIGVRLLCEKAKMCRFSVSLAPSVTLARATFLPEEGSSDELLCEKIVQGKKQKKNRAKEQKKTRKEKKETRENEKSPPPSERRRRGCFPFQMLQRRSGIHFRNGLMPFRRSRR